jgi:hypothetical protein
MNKIWLLITQAKHRLERSRLLWPIAAILFCLVVLVQIAFFGNSLVYSDYSYVSGNSIGRLWDNIWYPWSSGNFGFSQRYTLIYFVNLASSLLTFIHVDVAPFVLRIFLPFLVCFMSMYYIVRRLAPSRLAIIPAIFYVINPVVFGDFITGQTLWAYAVLPWVLYFWIEIFLHRKYTISNALLAALFLYFEYGALPPILIPLGVILFVIAAAGFVKACLEERTLRALLPFMAFPVVIGVVFAGLALPYLLATSSGGQSFVLASSIRDYIHNYSATTIENVLRLAGNQGNGQWPLGYNIPSFTNQFGYVVPTTIVIGLLMVKKRWKEQITPLLLLGVLLAIIGFIYVITEQRGLGIKLFSGNWMVAAIRNPQKLYVIMLVLTALLLGYALNHIEKIKMTSWQFTAITGVLLLSIVVYGWPGLRGDLGLIRTRQDDRAAVMKNDTTTKIIERAGSARGRAIVLPATHQEEIQYQNVSVPLSTFKLNGYLPGTALFVKEMQTAYRNQSDSFFTYLNMAGISSVYLRRPNSRDISTVLFKGDLDYDQAVVFLQGGGLHITHEEHDYMELTNDVKPLVYAPGRIANVDSESLAAVSPLLKDSVVVNVPGFANLTDRYGIVRASDKPVTGLARLYSPSTVSLVYYRQDGRIVLERTNPVLATTERVIERRLPEDVVLEIGGQLVEPTAVRQAMDVTAGTIVLRFFQVSDLTSAISNPSFEGGTPMVGDASVRRPEKADISSKTTGDASQGQKALLLSSRSHQAFVAIKLPKLQSDELYMLTFDYRNERGQAPAYSIVTRSKKTTYDYRHLIASKSWAHARASVKGIAGADMYLYLYTDTADGVLSENIFDNIRIIKPGPQPVETVSAAVAQYEMAYGVRGYSVASLGQNMVDNPSFEQPRLWGDPHELYSYATEGLVEVSANRDASHGDYSAELRAPGEAAYIMQRIGIDGAHKTYRLAFDYKNLRGSDAKLTVTQGGKTLLYDAVKPSKQWSTYEGFFTTVGNEDVTLQLYSPSWGEYTANLFDNVIVKPSNNVANYITEEGARHSEAPANIVESFERHSPTKLTVHLKRGNGLVVFNESFHKDWKAELVRPDRTLQIGKERHVTVNGFANGWFIDQTDFANEVEDFRLEVSFAPQKQFTAGMVISIGVLIVVLGSLVYIRMSRRDILSIG